MPDTPRSSHSQRTSQRMTASSGDLRAALAQAIPRRAGVSWWLGIVLALGFAALVTPAITADRWLLHFDVGTVTERHAAPVTVRAPMVGYGGLRAGGGVVVARGEIATRDEAALADTIAAAAPRGPVLYLAFFGLCFALAWLFTHHMRRSTKGRLVRVQIVSLALIAVLAAAVKIAALSTAVSVLVVPLAVLAMVPTMVLDRIVGLATGVLAALVISLQAPFDIGLALLLLVQAAVAGLVVAEGNKRRWLPALIAGLVTTLCTSATYLLVSYLTTGRAPDLGDPLHSPWLAAAIGPALAALITAPLVPIYQLLVGEITQGKLFALEDLGHPVLRQIAERSPGTWQHSLMMANMAEIAANAIGANGRLVRVGAYFHDLGKSLQPKYFIENLEPGETSPHDRLPPEVSCDAIFAHVTEGIVAARRAGLHERIVDFMHMHHGNGVLEYFWTRCREQGNPHGLTLERFRYPGHPPQSRETALLAICDAVEAASRTLKQPDAAAIDSLVQRIVYGKLHLGQLDESGLSMSDLRRISDSLRETIRHANHARIEYPWQKAGQDASASAVAYTTTAPRLDSLDRQPRRDSAHHAQAAADDAALAATDDVRNPAGRRASTAAPLATESSDAARIRAGTARNAQPAESPPAREPELTARLEVRGEPAPDREAARTASPVTLTGRAPAPGLPADDVRAPRADHAEAPRADEPSRDPASTQPGRAPSAASDAGLARAFERSAAVDTPVDPPPVIAQAALHSESGPALLGDAQPPRRDPMTTLPGRAPGPAARPEPAVVVDEPPQTSARTTLPPPELRPAATPAPRPATASPAPEPARSAGPPDPVDLDSLDSAATNPPQRRAPGGQPALPSDPAQLAAALASLVARVSEAPFGKPTSAEAAAVTQPTLATPPEPPSRGAGSDAAITQPSFPALPASAVPPPAISPPSAPHAAEVVQPAPAPVPHAAGTQPVFVTPAAPYAAGTQPAFAAPPAPLEPLLPLARGGGTPGHPAPLAGGKVRPEGKRRGAGDSRSVLLQTLRGHVDEASGLRRPATDPAVSARSAITSDDARVTVPRPATDPPAGDPPRTTGLASSDDARVTVPRAAARAIPAAHDFDAGVTEPSMPVLAVGDQVRVDLPVRPQPAQPTAAPLPGWTQGLAARIDAKIADEWGNETPIVPTNAELRALLGHPDPTRQQPVDEIELLHRRAAELADPVLPRRSPHPTTEVDPDDIESAIELAPPARRPTHPNAIGQVKPRKPK